MTCCGPLRLLMLFFAIAAKWSHPRSNVVFRDAKNCERSLFSGTPSCKRIVALSNSVLSACNLSASLSAPRNLWYLWPSCALHRGQTESRGRQLLHMRWSSGHLKMGAVSETSKQTGHSSSSSISEICPSISANKFLLVSYTTFKSAQAPLEASSCWIRSRSFSFSSSIFTSFSSNSFTLSHSALAFLNPLFSLLQWPQPAGFASCVPHLLPAV